jgi:hypothetical protein
LLNADDRNADYLVELLLPLLWLSHPNGVTRNPNVDGSMAVQGTGR